MQHHPIDFKDLPYEYTALMPSISKLTLEFHHDKHLKTYVDNFNKAIATDPNLKEIALTELLTDLPTLQSPELTAIRNNGGGVFNHYFYFAAMTMPNTSKPSELMLKSINDAFSSEAQFYAEFKVAALSQFGSGWAWLVMDANKKLCIIKTSNQDTPLELGFTPLLTLDVWEHAYYLDYQNRRVDYIDGFFNLINWAIVEERMG